MKKAIVGILAIVGGLAILALFGFTVLGMLTLAARPTVPSRVVLELDLERGVIEGIPDDPVAQWMLEDSLTVSDLVDALDRAADDRRVRGLIARIGSAPIGLAHIQEIREALFRFRDAGKPTIAFAESFGEFQPGNGVYYLATAFDEIHLQPTGDVGLTGLIYQTRFLRGALDKLGVVPQMDRRHEYKNAVNTYTEAGFTEPHREALRAVVQSHFDQLVRGIAEGRGFDDEEVRSLIDRGPLLAEEALEAGLVDHLSYRDEAWDRIAELAGARAELLYLERYLERAGRPHRRGTTVALIEGYGTIVRGRSGYSPLNGSVILGSDSLGSAFRAAIDDRRVEAILFRIDSPGGSPVASDAVWHETVRARESGKPVIVSMGNLAASGGYAVSMNATKIVAQPGTITASIGVYGGKFVTTELWDKLGVSFDDVHEGANATYWSTVHGYDERARERRSATLDRIYDDFTGKVADGRGLPLEHVRSIAGGRIWTGEQALEHGLVDALGGRNVALRVVREELGLDEDSPIRLKRFPPRRTAFDLWFAQRPDHSQRAALRALAAGLRAVQPTVQLLQRSGLLDGHVPAPLTELSVVR